MKKSELPILLVNLVALIGFAIYFLRQANHEFIMYVFVIVFFLVVFIFARRKIHFPDFVFWLLTLWALLHMSGGSVRINGTLLYDLILIPLSEKMPVFRFDQLVHIIGFGTATLVMFYILKPLLKPGIKAPVSLSILLISTGLGIGAFNETIEFAATILVPQTGVGGYENTSLDLVSNMIGAILASVFAIGFLNRPEKEKGSKK